MRRRTEYPTGSGTCLGRVRVVRTSSSSTSIPCATQETWSSGNRIRPIAAHYARGKAAWNVDTHLPASTTASWSLTNTQWPQWKSGLSGVRTSRWSPRSSMVEPQCWRIARSVAQPSGRSSTARGYRTAPASSDLVPSESVDGRVAECQDGHPAVACADSAGKPRRQPARSSSRRSWPSRTPSPCRWRLRRRGHRRSHQRGRSQPGAALANADSRDELFGRPLSLLTAT